MEDKNFESAMARNTTYKAFQSKYGLSQAQMAVFLGQLATESANFTRVYENLNYSAARLVQVFPKYFPTLQIANGYAGDPQKIANKVYANRMGNGDEKSGDGYKFRGRGYIQLTGRNNYAAFGKFVREDCVANPDLVATKYPLDSAYWFFRTNNILAGVNDITDATITNVTKKVNGGTNGLAQRINYTKTFYNQLG